MRRSQAAVALASIILLVGRTAGTQPVPGRPPDGVGALVTSLAHGGRFDEAAFVVRAALSPEAVPPSIPALDSDADRALGAHGRSLSTAELALLTAMAARAWTPGDLLDPQRLDRQDRGTYWYVRGVLAALAAWPGARHEPLTIARSAADRLEEVVGGATALNRTELRRISVLASIAAAQEERDELTLLLAHAERLDTQLRDAGLPDDEVLPLDELAGDLWLQLHRYADAQRYYRRVNERHPERTRAWLGRLRAARELGQPDEARACATRVRAAWQGSAALRSIAAELDSLK